MTSRGLQAAGFLEDELEKIGTAIERFWIACIEYTRRHNRDEHAVFIDVDTYVELHIRVCRALMNNFDDKSARGLAEQDWTEDLESFGEVRHESSSNVYSASALTR